MYLHLEHYFCYYPILSFSVTFASLRVDSNIFQFYFITQSIQEERTVCMRWEIFGKLPWAMKGSLSSEVLYLLLSKIFFSVFIGSPWVYRDLISVCAYCLLLSQKKKKRWRQLCTLLDYLEILIFLLFQNIIINENKLIFFQTLYWQKREFPPVGFEPDASRLPDECPNR